MHLDELVLVQGEPCHDLLVVGVNAERSSACLGDPGEPRRERFLRIQRIAWRRVRRHLSADLTNETLVSREFRFDRNAACALEREPCPVRERVVCSISDVVALFVVAAMVRFGRTPATKLEGCAAKPRELHGPAA
jgi:hypothetical protein